MHGFNSGEDPQLHVVTIAVGDRRDGCLVGFATQCSIIPWRYLVCLSVLNETYQLALIGDALAVHRLNEDQRDLARRFGGLTGSEVDKFSGLAWHPGVTGAPLIEGCAGYLEGTIQARVPFGDHWGFVLAPIAGEGDTQTSLRMSEVDVKAAHPPDEIFHHAAP